MVFAAARISVIGGPPLFTNPHHKAPLILMERRRSLSSGRASRGPVGRVSKDGMGPSLMVRDARAALLTMREGLNKMTAPSGQTLLVAIDLFAFLVALLRLDRERRDRARLQPLQRDRLAGLLAIGASGG